MTAQIVTPFGNPVQADRQERCAAKTLEHLKRPIRHNFPGTLWERVAEQDAA